MSSPPSASVGEGRLVWALGATQIVGYGTLYYSFSVLAPSIAREFGWSPEWVYGALSIGLIVGGLLAPVIGKAADRFGAARLMSIGSPVAALALVGTAFAADGIQFTLGLIAVEVASGLVLYGAAFAAIVQTGSRTAQRKIVHLTLIAGFASTLFWPLTGLLHQHLTWREIHLLFAAMHLAICLPLHLWLMGRAAAAPAKPSENTGKHPTEQARRAGRVLFGVMTAGFLVEGFVLSAMLVHMVPLLAGLGLGSSALLVTTLYGPAQVLGRLVNLAFGRNLPQTVLALIASAFLPIALGVLLVTSPSIAGAALFAVLFGLGGGLASIISGTLPLELFGSAGYGARIGWVSGARLLSSAVAPFVFALALSGAGVEVAMLGLVATGVAGAGAFVLLWMLSRGGSRAV